MKRFLLLFVVLIFVPCVNSHAQLSVFDPILNTLMELSYADQVIYYAQSLKNGIETAIHLKDQVLKAEQMLEKTAQNMQSIKNVDSWDDFMDWYNRQLYYERMSIETIKGMNVTVGKKNYSLYDLEGIRDGINETYVEYWDKEFTEEQRKEMWLGLGLSPSNYAYVQPYRVKGREVARILLTMSEIQNEKNKKTSEANKKDLDDLAADAELPEDKQMGQKSVMQRIWQALIRNTEVQEDIAAMKAKELEMQGIDKALGEPLDNPQQVSSWETGFKPLKK